MGVGADRSRRKKFTFAISSPDEFLVKSVSPNAVSNENSC